eukprot:GHVT01034934.1.p1 GENE.GHVT01034934.1~~GHVT01034934.1.p1  ORF type:complete len:328 (+),score=75.17 GHVT01034934.1:524-1507(+)
MFWDFLSLSPESLLQVTILMSDFGTPDGFRHMEGFGSHSFKFVAKQGRTSYVKFHWKPEAGVRNLSASSATALSGSSPDYSTLDLRASIASKAFPVWRLFVQILTPDEAMSYRFNVLDVTKVVYEKDYPLREVGRLVLNRNPANYFAEVEQAAFNPANLVDGIEPSEDKMLQGRLFTYGDAQRYRIGSNVHLVGVNQPLNASFGAYSHRDGIGGGVGSNGAGTPSYEPNSVEDSPRQTGPSDKRKTPHIACGAVGRHHNKPENPDDDFAQVRWYYEEKFSASERSALHANICASLREANAKIQQRQLALFYKVSKAYGDSVSACLKS